MTADRTEVIEGRRRYFSAVVRAAGLKSMAALAKKLGVTQPTLTNVRSGKRSASPELIEKIRQLAPAVEGGSILSADAMAHLDVPEEKDIRKIGRRLDQDHREQLQELQGLDEPKDQNIREILRNFEAMDRDDVFVYLSAIRSPLEMDLDEELLRPVIAAAILRRAFFLYLRPTKKHLKSLGDFVDVSEQFTVFKNKVFAGLPKEQRASFWNNLLLIQADANPLFVLPDFKWELFFSDRIDAAYKAAAGALISAGRPTNYPVLNIRIPLSPIATKRVLFEVARTIFVTNPHLEESERVPFYNVARLKDSAELATGERIEDIPS